MRRIGRIAKRTVSLVTGLAVLAAIGYGVLMLAGYRPVVVYTGSMEPSLRVGSLAFLEKTPSSTLQKGDVITFTDPYQPGRLVTHRITQTIERPEGRAYRTKGDANPAADPWTISLPAQAAQVAFDVPRGRLRPLVLEDARAALPPHPGRGVLAPRLRPSHHLAQAAGHKAHSVTRRLVLLALVAVAVVVAGGSTRMTSAAFTATTTVAGNTITADRVSNYFQVTPGSAVRPGTSTPVATGDVDTLALDFGTVPSAGTFTNVFSVQNVTGQPQTATLTSLGFTHVAAVVFASSGSSSATLAPSASTTVSVTSSSTALGLGTGTVRLGVSGSTWLYRNYATALVAAPQAPTSPAASARAAGRIDLAWSPSTTLGILGYDVYRATGGPYTKLNVAPVVGTTYSDTATTNGTAYTYRLRAVSTGSRASTVPPSAPRLTRLHRPSRPRLHSRTAAARAPRTSTWRTAPASRSSVTLPASAVASDTVTVVVTRGVTSVTATVPGRAGAGIVTVTGLNTTTLGDGAVTLSATTADAAGNASAARTATVTKDTVAPGVPTGDLHGFQQCNRRRHRRNGRGRLNGHGHTNASFGLRPVHGCRRRGRRLHGQCLRYERQAPHTGRSEVPHHCHGPRWKYRRGSDAELQRHEIARGSPVSGRPEVRTGERHAGHPEACLGSVLRPPNSFLRRHPRGGARGGPPGPRWRRRP